MYNKFKLRNLHNEVKCLENKREELLRQVDEIENTKLVFSGTVIDKSTMNATLNDTIPRIYSHGTSEDTFTIEFYQYKNKKVICELTDKLGNTFKGVAICHEDDSFSIAKGMRKAHKKALIEFYKYEINKY